MSAISMEIRHYRAQRKSWFTRDSFRSERIQANLHFIRQSLLAINITSRTFAAIAQSLHPGTCVLRPERNSLRALLQDLTNDIERILPQRQLSLNVAKTAAGAYILLDATDVGLVKTAFYNIVQLP
jgi:hypothetical protein